MNMNSKILTTIANVMDNKEDIKKRKENGQVVLQDILTCIQNCQNRFGGKSELATEDDVRIVQLCEKWERVLSHGIRTNLSSSAIQNLVTAGLNFTFNFIYIGNSLWSYCCLHMTKHEKERFKILSNINTPLGYFRAFLRAALNERSLERYLQSWISHGLLMEYFEEGALLRDLEASHLLPNMAAGLSSILFALSIDRQELNDTQQPNQSCKSELLIPLPTPVKSTGNIRRKPIRQVISFDKNEPSNDRIKSPSQMPSNADDLWKSAPATCLNSPDPKFLNNITSASEPTTSSECKSGVRHFFPDSVKGMDSPSQILSKLSECAKEIFSSSSSIDVNAVIKDDASDKSFNNIKISESDSEEVAGSINGSTSCLELCFTEDESIPEDKQINSILEAKERECLSLQMRYNQLEIVSKEKIQKLEKTVLDFSKENIRLKDQLRQYMSAVGMTVNLKNGNDGAEEVTQYEKKLVQVAEMHAELMEFNNHLQRRLQELEGSNSMEIVDSLPESNVKVHIPAAFLVGQKTRSYHVYQIFLKVGQEEWNVYHRYAKFYELHTQLKKCHPDIATYKFPPKKTLGKLEASVVDKRRASLQAYLRHVLLALPELRNCSSRAQLIMLLPFFGSSCSTKDKTLNQVLSRQQSSESVSTFEAL